MHTLSVKFHTYLGDATVSPNCVLTAPSLAGQTMTVAGTNYFWQPSYDPTIQLANSWNAATQTATFTVTGIQTFTNTYYQAGNTNVGCPLCTNATCAFTYNECNQTTPAGQYPDLSIMHLWDFIITFTNINPTTEYFWYEYYYGQTTVFHAYAQRIWADTSSLALTASFSPNNRQARSEFYFSLTNIPISLSYAQGAVTVLEFGDQLTGNAWNSPLIYSHRAAATAVNQNSGFYDQDIKRISCLCNELAATPNFQPGSCYSVYPNDPASQFVLPQIVIMNTYSTSSNTILECYIPDFSIPTTNFNGYRITAKLANPQNRYYFHTATGANAYNQFANEGSNMYGVLGALYRASITMVNNNAATTTNTTGLTISFSPTMNNYFVLDQ